MSESVTANSYSARSLGVVITEKVAKYEGVEPTDLRPLRNVIDPDALNSLFEPENGVSKNGCQIMFSYCGYEVTVDEDGRVTVTKNPDDPVES